MHSIVLILHRIGGINFEQGDKGPGPIVDAKFSTWRRYTAKPKLSVGNLDFELKVFEFDSTKSKQTESLLLLTM